VTRSWHASRPPWFGTKKLLFFLLILVLPKFEERRFISSLLDFAVQALFGEVWG
jgi:hypothetical protein